MKSVIHTALVFISLCSLALPGVGLAQNLLAQSLAAKTVLTGKMQAYIFDRPDHSSTISYYLEQGDVAGYRLVNNTGLENFSSFTAQSVTITGEMEAEVFRVDSIKNAPGVHSRAKLQNATGEKKIAMVRVNMDGDTVNCSPSQINNFMFDNTNSVQKLFEASSRGALTLLKEDEDGNNQVDVHGPYSITTGTGNTWEWQRSIKAQASAEGVDLNAYHLVAYFIPGGKLGGATGIASVECVYSSPGSSNCFAFLGACHWSVAAHELGHNFGFQHSAVDLNNDLSIPIQADQYGDFSSPMGNPHTMVFSGGLFSVGTAVPLPPMHFTGVHQYFAGWFDPFDESVVDIDRGGRYTIYALEDDPTVSPGPQLLKIRDAANPNDPHPYFLSYRRDSAPWSIADRYKGGVLIKRADEDAPNDATIDMTFVRKLSDNTSFEDPQQRLTIRQVSHTANSVTFDVTIPDLADEQRPVVELISPESQDKVSGEILVAATIRDNIGVASAQVELVIDRETRMTETIEFDGEREVNVTFRIAKEHFSDVTSSNMYVTVTGRDSAGNLGSGSATITHATGATWQNPDNNLDVSGDGNVSARDALVLIRYINDVGGNEVIQPENPRPDGFYLDVNGDGYVSTRDVIAVIQYINNANSLVTAKAISPSGEPMSDVTFSVFGESGTTKKAGIAMFSTSLLHFPYAVSAEPKGRYGFISENPTGETTFFGVQHHDFQAALLGDADRDGYVGFPDFLALSANMGRSDSAWHHGDFSQDGTVGFDDFLLLSKNFGRGVAPRGSRIKSTQKRGVKRLAARFKRARGKRKARAERALLKLGQRFIP